MQAFPQFFQSIYSNKIFATVLLAWTIIWKGLALWKAAGKKDKIWFIALLVLNTLGLVEILYYFVFSKRGKLKV